MSDQNELKKGKIYFKGTYSGLQVEGDNNINKYLIQAEIIVRTQK